MEGEHESADMAPWRRIADRCQRLLDSLLIDRELNQWEREKAARKSTEPKAPDHA
jgi:hypothetical protein